ncbi:MAG: hypothetical protein HPY66_0012 [Firmicutes bacterium]|nr:hypothetical protein [Bacillota bacterium]
MDALLAEAAKKCEEYRLMRYHCSESSIRALSEVFDIDLSEELLRVSSGFRGGGGGYRERCGIVETGIMLISLRYGRISPGDSADEYSYLIRVLHERFLAELGSYTCRVLRPFSQRIAPDNSGSFVYREGVKIVARLLLEADGLISDIPEEERNK